MSLKTESDQLRRLEKYLFALAVSQRVN